MSKINNKYDIIGELKCERWTINMTNLYVPNVCQSIQETEMQRIGIGNVFVLFSSFATNNPSFLIALDIVHKTISFLKWKNFTLSALSGVDTMQWQRDRRTHLRPLFRHVSRKLAKIDESIPIPILN